MPARTGRKACNRGMYDNARLSQAEPPGDPGPDGVPIGQAQRDRHGADIGEESRPSNRWPGTFRIRLCDYLEFSQSGT